MPGYNKGKTEPNISETNIHIYFSSIVRIEHLAQRDLFEWLLNTFVVTIEIFPKILSRFLFVLSQSPLCHFLFSNKKIYKWLVL